MNNPNQNADNHLIIGGKTNRIGSETSSSYYMMVDFSSHYIDGTFL